MSKQPDDYMDEILNGLNEDEVVSSESKPDKLSDAEPNAKNDTTEKSEDDWFDGVEFDSEGPQTPEDNENDREEYDTQSSVNETPDDEFSVDIDDDVMSSDDFDDSVLGADPVPGDIVMGEEEGFGDEPEVSSEDEEKEIDTEKELAEQPESVITPDDLDDEFSDSLLLDAPVENESLVDESGASALDDEPKIASETEVEPSTNDAADEDDEAPDDTDVDVDGLFSSSMFEDDEDDESPSSSSSTSLSPDSDKSVSPTVNTPNVRDSNENDIDSDDDMMDVEMADPLYDDMIGDDDDTDDAEESSEPVEDLSLIDVEDVEDDLEYSDQAATEAFAGDSDMDDISLVESLDQMEDTLASLDTIADDDIQPSNEDETEVGGEQKNASNKPNKVESMTEENRAEVTDVEKTDSEENHTNSSSSPHQSDALPMRTKGVGVGGLIGAVALSVMMSVGGMVGALHYGFEPLANLSGSSSDTVNEIVDQKARASITTMQDEISALKSDRTAMVKRYEEVMSELRSAVEELRSEQTNIERLVTQIREEASAYESMMVERLEKQLSLMLSLSEKQTNQRQAITEQVLREVDSYLKDKERASKNNLEPLLEELSDAVARVGRIESRVREQGQLISMVESESDYVKAMVERIEQSKSEQAKAEVKSDPKVRVETDKGSDGNVEPKKQPSSPSRASDESAGTSPSLPSLTLTAVFENRENGVMQYELFIQDEADRGTHRSTLYVFTQGRSTTIPGYGRILRVEKVNDNTRDIHYQVVTENGVIKGAL